MNSMASCTCPEGESGVSWTASMNSSITPTIPEAYLFESVATRQVLNGLVVEAEYAFRVGACLHCGTRKEDSELKEAGFDDIRAVGLAEEDLGQDIVEHPLCFGPMPAADCRKKFSFLLGGVEAADRELLFNVLAFLDGLAEQPLLPVYLIPLLEGQVLRTNYVRGYCKEEFCSGLDANSRHLFEFAYGRFKLGEGNIKVAKVFYGVAHEVLV